MLFASLPGIHQTELIEKIVGHLLIDAVRYNVGAVSPYSPKETLQKVLDVTRTNGKELWVDLKGRQLRITQWAAPVYGRILLNHKVTINGPARVFFRGNEQSEIVSARGNEIFVSPPPRHAVGQGQAINIIGDDVRIEGFLTNDDKDYIRAAVELGVYNFMLSFVESTDDIAEVEEIIMTCRPNGVTTPEALVLKIESLRGLELVKKESQALLRHYRLMAARDDLYINIGENKAMILNAVQDILEKDKEAIAASRIFSGLETSGEVSLADFSDLKLLWEFGYNNFLLSDGICQRHFDEAITAWQDFQDYLGDPDSARGGRII